MITDKMQLRPRYGEVDKMGYVYHANYVSYCHQARTELLRKLDIHDDALEENGIMLPVISFEIKYKKPAIYDETLTIITTINEVPQARFMFHFDIYNDKKVLVSKAKSTVVFVDSHTRTPLVAPVYIQDIIKRKFEESFVIG